MKLKSLFIVGAGGFGREVWEWANTCADNGRVWEIAGFLDDNATALEGFALPHGVVGPISTHIPREDNVYLCALGMPASKRRVCSAMRDKGAEFISLVHPTAIIGHSVEIGTGSVICPRVVLTTNIKLGEFVTLNCQSGVGHDVTIGKFTTLSAFCDATGGVLIGEEVFMGSHAVVLPKRRVGDRAIVGAGSVVISSVKPGQTVFGVPARRLA